MNLRRSFQEVFPPPFNMSKGRKKTNSEGLYPTALKGAGRYYLLDFHLVGVE